MEGSMMETMTEASRGIPSLVRDGYEVFDADSSLFLDLFDMEAGSSVLEIGEREPLADILKGAGFNVLKSPASICDPSFDFIVRHYGKIDSIFAIGSINLIGLDALDDDADIVAVRTINKLLRMDGAFFVSVPFGKKHAADWTNRIYDKESLVERIVQDLYLEASAFFFVSPTYHKGRYYGVGDGIQEELAETFDPGKHPNLRAFLKLRK